MRLSYIVLVAGVALLSNYEGVSAANANQAKLSAMTSPDVAISAGQEVNVDSRFLKVNELTEEEERAFPISIPGLTGLKASLAKMKFRTWFSASKTPAQVNAELGLATATTGSFNWKLATGYAAYFRNLRYGPYVIAETVGSTTE